jgi:hypothetical protein
MLAQKINEDVDMMRMMTREREGRECCPVAAIMAKMNTFSNHFLLDFQNK